MYVRIPPRIVRERPFRPKIMASYPIIAVDTKLVRPRMVHGPCVRCTVPVAAPGLVA